MKVLLPLLCLFLCAGCAGRHPKGTSRYDQFDAVKVDQMVGNNVSQTVLAKTIVCLNARRETRRVTALTNTVVLSTTNPVVSAVTNETISASINYLATSMTNLEPLAPPLALLSVGDNAPGPSAEGKTEAIPPALTNVVPAMTTNVTVSFATNQSTTKAPNQRTANTQIVRTLNNQLTTRSNNLSVATMTNLVTMGETNQVVTFVTNSLVASVTNVYITPTNTFIHDYFFFTELIPPPDFTLQTGESLILLVDGVRYGFTQGQSSTAFVGRRRYISTLYRTPPEALVALANAKEVRVRLKGVNSVIERQMSNASRQNFRAFLAKYFTPESAPNTPAPSMAAWGGAAAAR